MSYRPAPGYVVCRLRPDITEKDGYLVPGGQRDNWAEVVAVGPRSIWARLFGPKVRVGEEVLLPHSRNVFGDGEYCAVKISEIRVKL